jgi:hypothetical protein
MALSLPAWRVIGSCAAADAAYSARSSAVKERAGR